jgi:WD domain, G-beta repeat.
MPTGSILAVAFSPDGTRIAIGDSDATAHLWNVRFPTDPFRAVCDLTNGPMSEDDWAQYLPDEPYRTVCHWPYCS